MCTHITGWDELKKVRVPIIAAVNGWALGGGCELAMYCDMIIASENAKFGQPEITLGTIPGMGGTQRLTRAVGKSKAMEWILTGAPFDAHTAERVGLVSRVVPAADLLAEAEKTATKIASMSRPISLLAKECVNKAYEGTLEDGVVYERRLFFSTFATVCALLLMSTDLQRKIRWKEWLLSLRRDLLPGKMNNSLIKQSCQVMNCGHCPESLRLALHVLSQS